MQQYPVASRFASKDAALVYYIGKGLPIDDSLKRSGFATFPVKTLMRPDVQKVIEKTWKNELRVNMARCRAILMEFVENEKLAPTTRIDAAKTLYSWLGKEDESGALDKPLSEMTGNELRQSIESLQREIGVRATGAKAIDAALPGAVTIDNAPVIDVEYSQSLDILG